MESSYDPYKEMKNFYRKGEPSDEEQFRFVETMRYLIDTAVFDDDINAFSYNLAMYYRSIRNYRLEKKYLEIGAEHGRSLCKEQLGFIWYYGLGVKRDYEKAFRFFLIVIRGVGHL